MFKKNNYSFNVTWFHDYAPMWKTCARKPIDVRTLSVRVQAYGSAVADKRQLVKFNFKKCTFAMRAT